MFRGVASKLALVLLLLILLVLTVLLVLQYLSNVLRDLNVYYGSYVNHVLNELHDLNVYCYELRVLNDFHAHY